MTVGEAKRQQSRVILFFCGFCRQWAAFFAFWGEGGASRCGGRFRIFGCEFLLSLNKRDYSASRRGFLFVPAKRNQKLAGGHPQPPGTLHLGASLPYRRLQLCTDLYINHAPSASLGATFAKESVCSSCPSRLPDRMANHASGCRAASKRLRGKLFHRTTAPSEAWCCRRARHAA